MRCALHVSGLRKKFEGALDPAADLKIDAANLAITSGILSEYTQELASNPDFTAWWSQRESAKRISLISDSFLRELEVLHMNGSLKEYLGAAFFNGKRFLSTADCHLRVRDQKEFVAHGIQIMDVDNAHQAAQLPMGGDNHIERFDLSKRTGVSPEAVTRFLKAEKRVVAFDRYMRLRTFPLLAEVVRACGRGCKLMLLTSTKVKSDAKNLVQKLQKLRKDLDIQLFFVTEKTYEEMHDRWIFAGDRWQISFTAGFDCFSRAGRGKWANKDCRITVDDVSQEPIASFFVREQSKPISVRKCGGSQ